MHYAISSNPNVLIRTDRPRCRRRQRSNQQGFSWRYHNRINDLSDHEGLIKCAFVEGMHDPAYLFWSHKVHTWLQGQCEGLGIEDELDVGTVIGSARPIMHRHGIRIVSAVLLGTNLYSQNMS